MKTHQRINASRLEVDYIMTYLSRTRAPHHSAHAHSAHARGWTISALASLYRSRRALAGLDEDALRDIGIDRKTALREARRAVWDLPRCWAR